MTSASYLQSIQAPKVQVAIIWVNIYQTTFFIDMRIKIHKINTFQYDVFIIICIDIDFDASFDDMNLYFKNEIEIKS